MLKRALKEFLKHSKESRGVPWQESSRESSRDSSRESSRESSRGSSTQEGAQEEAQEEAQVEQLQASMQASTRKAFSRSHALEGLVPIYKKYSFYNLQK